MSISKITLLDKVKIELSSDADSTRLEANNLKLSVFPESLRELQRVWGIINSSQLPLFQRFQFTNKTMKNLHLIPYTKQYKNEES